MTTDSVRRAAKRCGPALALAVAALSLAPPAALAAPTSPTDVADTTLTVGDLLPGDTVSAYLIADADIDAANNLTYTMAPACRRPTTPSTRSPPSPPTEPRSSRAATCRMRRRPSRRR